MKNANHMANLTPEYLSELLTNNDEANLERYGPLKLLAELAVEVAVEEELTPAQSLNFIAMRGRDWNGGREGRIAVRVRDRGDNLEVQWVDGEGCWCSLGNLLDAVQNGNRFPTWYVHDWVEVQDGEGSWVKRNVVDRRSGID